MDDNAFCGTIAALLNVPAERVTLDVRLRDLTPDSFALVELVVDLQDHYQVAFVQTDFRDVHTVRDLALLFSGRMAQTNAARPE
jgi:acyl carrier protein